MLGMLGMCRDIAFNASIDTRTRVLAVSKVSRDMSEIPILTSRFPSRFVRNQESGNGQSLNDEIAHNG